MHAANGSRSARELAHSRPTYDGPVRDFERAYYEAESFWAGDALLDEANRRRVAETATLIPGDVGSLLDVGCGNGVFGRHVAAERPGVEVTNMDRSEAALTYVHTAKRLGDITAIPADDREFDCVTCLEVIEHLSAVDYGLALAELARVSDRYVVIGVPYREAIDKNVTTCPQCRTTFNIDFHLRSFSDEHLHGLFPQAEFKLVRMVFPGRGTRKLLLTNILEARSRWRARTLRKRFLSPICPVCGYTEGDVTMLALQSGAVVEPPSSRRPALVTCRRAARRLFEAWPTVEVRGYWVAALYERV